MEQLLRKNTAKPAVIPIGTRRCQSPPKLQEVCARVWGKEAFTCQLEKGLLVSMCQNCICRYLCTLLSLASHSLFMVGMRKRIFRKETSISFILPCPNKQFYDFKVDYDMARHLTLISNGTDAKKYKQRWPSHHPIWIDFPKPFIWETKVC